jgi:hypothetical protein
MEALIAPLANEEHSQMTTLLQRLFAEGKADLATIESWTRRGVLAASLDEVTDPNRA